MTGEFPTQRASNAEMVPFDDVIMFLIGGVRGHFTLVPDGRVLLSQTALVVIDGMVFTVISYVWALIHVLFTSAYIIFIITQPVRVFQIKQSSSV